MQHFGCLLQQICYKGLCQTELPQHSLSIKVLLTCVISVQIVAVFRQAARNAIDAGFDGVEVHGANVSLLHDCMSACSIATEF